MSNSAITRAMNGSTLFPMNEWHRCQDQREAEFLRDVHRAAKANGKLPENNLLEICHTDGEWFYRTSES